MEKRIPYYNRFNPELLGELKELSAEKKIPVAELLDQAIDLLLRKYRQPEPVSPVVEKTDSKEKQIVISITKPPRKRGNLRLHNDKWYARFRIGRDETGKSKQREFYLGTAKNMTRGEAEAKLEDIAKQIEEQN